VFEFVAILCDIIKFLGYIAE
jgi:hypothetical protein